MAALGCALTAACSSGGSGGGGATGTPATTTTGPSGTGGTYTGVYDTGIAGSVGAPPPATFGTAQAQTAGVATPTFDGGPYPVNVTFPLLLTSFQKSATGLSAAPADQSATATVVNTSTTASTLVLNIPSLGMNETLTFHTNLVSHLGQVTDGLSYVVMGEWGARTSPSIVQNQALFVFGFETPSTAMPKSGTAVFTSTLGGAGAWVDKPVNGEIQATYVYGNAAITADFSSGQVTGNLTSMKTLNNEQWNDVSLTANIASGTNRFSGTAAATSAPGTSMSLAGSASGHLDGAFFGPAAQNLGATWSLSDGTGSALGTLTAGHQ